MGVEVRPLNVLCNIQCRYCYQDPQRAAGNITRLYDLDKLRAAIEAEGRPFALFGGEPLLAPIGDLERLWSWGLERFGRNSVQTNGILISDQHLALFRKYKVHVGISIDGPGELNDARWHSSLSRTRSSTAATEAAIAALCAEGNPPAIIITLHRVNASAERLPRLLAWVRGLARSGVRALRLHLLESESAAVRDHLALTEAENIAAMEAFYRLDIEGTGLLIDTFRDLRRLLLGEDARVTCVWKACDPYTTAAVTGIEGDGQRTNCGRKNKDGIDFAKANRPGFERPVALFETPQSCGGCAGCRFFLMCKGQCPGTAIGGDWRNRTEHCGTWKALFGLVEAELVAAGKVPVSRSNLRADLERRAVSHWKEGNNPNIADLILEAVEDAGTAR